MPSTCWEPLTAHQRTYAEVQLAVPEEVDDSIRQFRWYPQRHPVTLKKQRMIPLVKGRYLETKIPAVGGSAWGRMVTVKAKGSEK
jgi:hypothetical protein